jgi:RND family efflux transporter MFP subunit
MRVERSLLFLMLCGGIAGCSAPAKQTDAGNVARASVPVQVENAKSGTFTDAVSVSGSVKALNVYEVAPRIGGRLASVNVTEGQMLTAGQVVATIETKDFEIALAGATALQRSAAAAILQSEANVNVAKLRLNQAKRSLESQVTTGDVGVRDAEDALSIAKEQLEIARRPQRTQEVIAAESSVAQAEANLVKASADRKRYESLVREGAASQSQLDQAVNGEAVATATLRSATAQLDLVRTGGRAESIKQAELVVRRAEQAVRLAKTSSITSNIKEDDVAAAKAALSQATAALSQATASAANAAASVAQARQSLAECTVRATMSGRVSKRIAEPGQSISVGNPIVQVVPEGTLVFEASVPESDVSKVRLGTQAILEVTGVSRSLPATVVDISSVTEQNSRNYRVRLSIAGNINDVRSGMYATANIQIRKLTATGIQKSALVTKTDGSTYVYVVENETAKLKVVKVLYQNAETCAVSGIEPDEVVVINGTGNLSDGSAVRIPKGQ